MKKRMLALLLMVVMCITLVSPATVSAAETVQAEAENTTAVNSWAIPDLLSGDTYGIYPLTWYNNGLTGPIRNAQFRVLIAGLRCKILDTKCATESRSAKLVLDSSITVEEAIRALFTVISDYDYTVDLGINTVTDPIAFMKLCGIYTGENGEQALEDPCSKEMALVMATRIVTLLYYALDASSKGFLWEVKSGDNTVYLLGSIHMASSVIYPFSNKMLAAYQSSDALVVEADLNNTDEIMAMGQLAVYSDGTTLKDHVSAECYQKSVETAALFGLTEDIVAYLKPWYLFLLFENFAVAGNVDADKIVAQLGIDVNFMNNAYIYQKPVYQIEGVLKQAMMLDSFSAGLQEFLLNVDIEAVNAVINGTSTDDVTDANEMADLMLEYWHDGNVEAFKEMFADDDLEAFEGVTDSELQEYMNEYKEKLLTQRDKGMADYIDSLLKLEGSNTFFVVVGAAHYISDYSVLDILEEKGYVITQIK